MKNFAMIGVGGYIAPRHMKAIKETGNNLIAAMDKNDSVGIMDSFFPDADFFVEYERFDRHLHKLKRNGVKLDYLTVCSPNYLHDSHAAFGLMHGMDVICEKPLVLNPWNLDSIQEVEKETGKKVNVILQLRHHPKIIELKEQIQKADKVCEVDLTYITSRGKWYYTSWKGDIHKSGGIATNIGIHFFDMLGWIFGEAKENIVHLHTHDRAAGIIKFEKANVKWFLSINSQLLPDEIKAKAQTTFRSITVDGKEIEFSEGFTDLHTVSYREILKGKGFGTEDARKAVEIAYNIRNSKPIGLNGDHHKLAEKPLSEHPFATI
jgi:UDP-N-acetyl-2-amino-2-deoxyglucuronate dehydrogenase